MANTVFYLKYRPQSLDELVGQSHIKTALLTAFTQNRLSHAYLFVGPRGIGKTSTARILAKMVNCEGENVPCNKCSTCISITDGSNLDLIEIDGASNRGIEDIRSLREKIKLSPTSSKKKVYIIDEAHMLTPEAFNALLKTLEEPPAHALFILATTEVQKLPQTILSRVQRLDFKLATPAELMETLKKIIISEKIDIDEEALKLLVKKSDGSFRDGIKFLDQVSSMGDKITVEVLQKSLRSTNFEVVYELVENFGKKDTTTTLSLILKQIEGGADAKELILALMDTLRNLVFIKNGLGENLVKGNFLEDKYQNLIKVSENFSNQDLVRNLDSLQTALEKMKTASIPSLPLELAVVEICGLEQIEKQASLKSVKAISEVERITESMIEKDSGVKQTTSVGNGDARDALRPDELPTPGSASNDDILKLKEKWTFVLETIRPFNFSLEALLRSINITECTDTKIIMEVPYSFHQRILEAPKNRDLLESILSDVLGRSIQVATVLGNRPVRNEDIANIEVAADDEIIRAAAEIFNSDSIN